MLWVNAILRNFLSRDGNDAGVKTLKSSLLESVNERFAGIQEEPLYAISTLTDPRFKEKFFTEAVLTTIKASAILAFNGSSSNSGSATATATVTASSTPASLDTESVTLQPPLKKARVENSVLWECMDEVVQSTTGEEQQATSNIETQLAQYLSEPVIARTRTEDPLLWWRQNKERLPDLARLARVYLGPPPTSVPSERLFSVAGEVVSDHRSALLPENASRLIFLKYNAKLIHE